MATEEQHQQQVAALRPDAVVWRAVDDEVVALDLRAQEYLAINNTGAALWPALQGGATTQQLVELLVERFEVSPEQAAADVEAFLSTLLARGVVEWRSPT